MTKQISRTEQITQKQTHPWEHLIFNTSSVVVQWAWEAWTTVVLQEHIRACEDALNSGYIMDIKVTHGQQSKSETTRFQNKTRDGLGEPPTIDFVKKTQNVQIIKDDADTWSFAVTKNFQILKK